MNHPSHEIATDPSAPGWAWTPEDLRALMDRAARLCATVLEDAAHDPVTRPLPPALREGMAARPLPRAGEDAGRVLERIAEEIAPHPFGNGHPRFLAWVNSPAHPVGVAAAAVASALNPSVAGGRHAAVHLEHQVVRWFLELLGWEPPASHGLLTSGGSHATLTALAAARHRAYAGRGLDDRADGLAGAVPVLYATDAAHSCVVKAVEALGLGHRAIRRIPADARDRMLPEALRAALAEDAAAGRLPVAVVASVGTVNTGAVDPLEEIAEACAEHGAWLHVDGAYGGPAALLLPELDDVRRALSRADSLALDPHKWLYAPVDAGMVLFRDARAARETFSLVPPYLQAEPSPDEPVWLSEYGLEQTRPFRALKLWAQLCHLGAEGYRDLIRHDLAVARALRDAVESAGDMELLGHGLSVVCFRHVPPGLDAAGLDELQRRLAAEVQRGGEAFIAPTTVDGVVALRACVVNPLTTDADAVAVLDAIRRAAGGPSAG